MASEEVALVLSHRLDGYHPQLLFQDDSSLGFCRTPPPRRSNYHTAGPTVDNNNNKTTRELTGFIDYRHRHIRPQATTEFRRSMCSAGIQDWGGRNGRPSDSLSGDGSDDDEDVDEDDVDGLVNCNDDVKNNYSGSEKIGKVNRFFSFGSSRELMKEESVMPSGNDTNEVRMSLSENHQQGQVVQYQNPMTITDTDGESYYSQYLHEAEESGAGLKYMGVENGCGFSGRKDISSSGESGESLRAILSDPLTGALMDDAMILSCGHSFGSGGMHHVMRMKACSICGHPVSEDSMASNLSLRAAVQAFRREESLQVHRASKRRRERFEQHKSSYGDSMFMDQLRCSGVQYPFSVTDRVLIKGNKRTPPRFVGREAVVTTQCLNGWYVVKTLDNAESIKLQYRSLAKVPETPSLKPTSSKMTPNWL